MSKKGLKEKKKSSNQILNILNIYVDWTASVV
jgi:hypothetical protein